MAQRSRITDGAKILAAREGLGVPQAEMARRIGVSPSYLSRIETGKETPGLTSPTVRQLAVELKCDLDDITVPAPAAVPA
jgi:transcriptional regulator with XRE-family HTH domain